MSGGGVSSQVTPPTVAPLKNPLITAQQPAAQPAITNPMNNQGQNPAISGFVVPYFQGGNLYSSFNPANNTYTVNDQYLQPTIDNLNNTFQSGAQAFANLGQTVQPGFSIFRQTGLQNIESARQASQSNLQSNLAQRRVQGSSFANSQISQNNADFAEKSANFIAQSYLQELAASSALTQQQYSMSAQGYNAVLQQSNLEASLAAQMSGQMSTTLASVAETQGQLDLGAAQTNAQGAIAQSQLTLQSQEFNTQVQEFNAQMQMAEMMGVGQLAGGLLGSGMGKSDIRVKRDIKQIGKWINGLPIYLFRYIFDPNWFVGFMAQDVEKVMPEAVFEIGGIKHVDYSLAVRAGNG